MASLGTEAKDRGEKVRRYAKMGVPECWLLDPRGDVFPRGAPRLQGHRLKGGKYVALAPRLVAGERVVGSRALGLDRVRTATKVLPPKAARPNIPRHVPAQMDMALAAMTG